LLIVAGLLESIDGIVAGVVIGEDLGEEEAQGDPGGVDPLAPEVAAATAGDLDKRPREEVEEGESVSVVELFPQGMESAGDRGEGRLRHGDLLGVGTRYVRLSTTTLPTEKVAPRPESPRIPTSGDFDG